MRPWRAVAGRGRSERRLRHLHSHARVPQADQLQLGFHPVTRGTDPVGVIYASPAPGGCLLVFGATARPDNNTAQGEVYVPHGCQRAVAAPEGGTRR